MKHVTMWTAGTAAAALLLAACSSGNTSSPESTTAPANPASPSAEASVSIRDGADSSADDGSGATAQGESVAEPMEPTYPQAGLAEVSSWNYFADRVTWRVPTSGEPVPVVQLDESSLVLFGEPPFGQFAALCRPPGEKLLPRPEAVQVSVELDSGPRTGWIAACSFDDSDPGVWEDTDATANYIILDPVDEPVSLGAPVASIGQVPQLPAATGEKFTVEDLQGGFATLRDQVQGRTDNEVTTITFQAPDCEGCVIRAMTYRADSEEARMDYDLSYEWNPGLGVGSGEVENGIATLIVPTGATAGMVFMIEGPGLDDEFANLAIAMAPDYEEYGEMWPEACWAGTSESAVTVDLKVGKSQSGSKAVWDASLSKPVRSPGFQDTPVCVVSP